MGKLNTLGNVALEINDGLLQETLLLLGDALERVVGLFSTVGLHIQKSVRLNEC